MLIPIIVKLGSQRFHLVAEQVYKDKQFERYKVYPKTNPCKYIILQNNRPLVRFRHRLKHKALDWKLLEGQALNRYAYEQTIKAIEDYLEPKPPKKDLECGIDLSTDITDDDPKTQKRKEPENIPLSEWVNGDKTLK